MSDNPYVGPRAFLENEPLFGRDEEICRLLDLLIAERIVLLYSPSGAGKTSLVHAGLVPRLREEGFDVKPGLRVNANVPAGVDIPPAFNRYVYSVLDSLERTGPDSPIERSELARMTLRQYFDRRFGDSARPMTVFHFDQFEELITVDPTDIPAKQEFFRELGLVLRDRRLWAVFAMREETLAAVDSYASLIPTRFQARFRLDFLSPAAAEQAIRQPAARHGVTFSAAPQLVRDLSLMRVQRHDGTTETVPGPWIEPVQLQVVCRSLWNKPRVKPDEISESDRMGVVDVDSALGEYYGDCLARVAAQSNTKERDLRDWIETRLITARGVRAQVLREGDDTQGLPNDVLELLRDDHLVRSEERRGLVWYELAHDRLIEPIRNSNLLFAESRMHPFQKRAREWNNRGRKAQFLLRDADLVTAQAWAKENDAELTPIEREFLTDSLSSLSTLEQLVFEWESAQRNPSLLARDNALKGVMAGLPKRPLTRSETSFLTLSHEITRLERSARIRERVSQVLTAVVLIGLLAGLGSLKYFHDRKVEKDRLLLTRNDELAAVYASLGGSELAKTFAVNPTETTAQPIGEIVNAQKQITAIAQQAEAPPTTRIKYYRKERDSVKFAQALGSLGFEVALPSSRTTNPTNCMWYGPDVPENDVRLVAYAAIRAGIELQGIQAMTVSDGAENVIQIGNSPRLSDEPPFTVEQVANSSLAALQRRLASQELGERGVIKSFDAAAGEGTLTGADGQDVYFRTFGNTDLRFSPGDPVAFDLYIGRRRYAVNVRPAAPRRPDLEQRRPDEKRMTEEKSLEQRRLDEKRMMEAKFLEQKLLEQQQRTQHRPPQQGPPQKRPPQKPPAQ